MKQVLVLQTFEPSLRNTVQGWTCESPELVVKGKEIGFTKLPHCSEYATVLSALADGWEMLGPPVVLPECKPWPTTWEWWLTRRTR
jgi:hypothetical protein